MDLKRKQSSSKTMIKYVIFFISIATKYSALSFECESKRFKILEAKSGKGSKRCSRDYY